MFNVFFNGENELDFKFFLMHLIHSTAQPSDTTPKWRKSFITIVFTFNSFSELKNTLDIHLYKVIVDDVSVRPNSLTEAERIE